MSKARKSTGTVADYTMLTDYADHIPRKRPEEVTDMKRQLKRAPIEAEIRADERAKVVAEVEARIEGERIRPGQDTDVGSITSYNRAIDDCLNAIKGADHD